jgi:hypothetical protein
MAAPPGDAQVQDDEVRARCVHAADYAAQKVQRLLAVLDHVYRHQVVFAQRVLEKGRVHRIVLHDEEP